MNWTIIFRTQLSKIKLCLAFQSSNSDCPIRVILTLAFLCQVILHTCIFSIPQLLCAHRQIQFIISSLVNRPPTSLAMDTQSNEDASLGFLKTAPRGTLRKPETDKDKIGGAAFHLIRERGRIELHILENIRDQKQSEKRRISHHPPPQFHRRRQTSALHLESGVADVKDWSKITKSAGFCPYPKLHSSCGSSTKAWGESVEHPPGRVKEITCNRRKIKDKRINGPKSLFRTLGHRK